MRTLYDVPWQDLVNVIQSLSVVTRISTIYAMILPFATLGGCHDNERELWVTSDTVGIPFGGEGLPEIIKLIMYACKIFQNEKKPNILNMVSLLNL